MNSCKEAKEKLNIDVDCCSDCHDKIKLGKLDLMPCQIEGETYGVCCQVFDAVSLINSKKRRTT